jgi:4-hydroxy-tetrahydrodipicolinate reductase
VSAIAVHVHGANGRMGAACVRAIGAAADLRVAGATDGRDDLAAALARSQPDVVVEFTVAAAAPRHLLAVAAAGCHAVSGTTGLASADVDALAAAFTRAERGVLLAPNFALGVILLQRFAREAARYFPDVEILELHHEHKRDAPSGTALATARQIASAAPGPCNPGRVAEHVEVPGCRGGVVDGIPVHAVRLPGLLAHLDVLFGGAGQLLRLRHDTTDRTAFMPGVLHAIRAVRARRGLLRSLEDLLV